ncbi:hypothetical protein CLU96_1918 [Chryseobacterium sp. 52]|uniref:DUF2586 family protein n=1 Tax=Chryseobacterium sp. 52 TaxID=2035213 RepID=UPI000C1A4BF2|nr:DUF2586 family protein [Chryseobacterium sp. 52]PIF44919.1 hypothetical protein CLU96_1918 [Chryseobacterium sp. 52]
MNGIKFIRGNGGLSRTLTGSDHVSGLIVYGEADLAQTLVLSIDDLDNNDITAVSNPVLHYHVSEFFRINPGAKLYTQSIEDSDGTYTEVKTLQNFAGGEIRQLAVCDFTTASTNLVTRLATLNQLAVDLGNLNIPLSLLFSVKIASADMATLPDLHTHEYDRVSVIIGQDAGGRGKYLAATKPSISCIGTALGAVSKARVHESIGWVEKQNLVSTAYPKALTNNVEMAREMDVSGFCDGSLIGDYTPQQIQAISDKGYLFGVKYTGSAGTYFNDSFTATTLESDYAYIENNRAIDKGIRGIYKALLPKISGPSYVDPDTGYLDPSTVSALEALCDDVLDQMVRDGEISGYKNYINPDQAILRNSKLEIVSKMVPVGTLREITVRIGLTLQINQ